MSGDRIEIVLERMQKVPPISWEKIQSLEKSQNIHERLPGLCADPIHLHSFAKEFSLSSFVRMRKCIGCRNRFVTSTSGSSQQPTKSMRFVLEFATGKDGELLRCVACGIYAHRSCVFNQQRILDTCKIHQMAFEKRKQLKYNTDLHRPDYIKKDELSNGFDVMLETTNSTSIYMDELSTICDADSPLNCSSRDLCTSIGEPFSNAPIETNGEDTSSIIWTPNGPPAHFAQVKPHVLWGIKSKTNELNESDNHSAPISGGETSNLVEEPNLGQSFMNASKVLQDTLFRYFSRHQNDEDKDETSPPDILCANESSTNVAHVLLAQKDEDQHETISSDDIISSNDPVAVEGGLSLSTNEDPVIPLNLSVSPQPEKNRDKSMSFLENSLKGVRFDSLAKKGLQWATAAGSFAGGLAGLFMAGPSGMYIGSKIGTVACVASVVGIVLEGPIGVGILVVGGVATLLSAKNTKADEKRLLTLGDDTGKLMMVRSNIVIDPIWELILASARKSTPTTVKLPGLVSNAEKRRRLRDINIISSDESELTFSNKVFLLVSSSLNDKKSQPGHVYRYLMREYRKRALKHMHDRALKTSPEILRATRQDTHAIIKFVTAVLLEARPGLAESFRLEEITSSTVETLVFGEVYDLVLQEILDETREIDNNLMLKISEFQVSAKTDFHDYVAERALHALRSLPDAHSVGEKLSHIVLFLEEISYRFSLDQKSHRAICADNLLEMVCQHLIVAKVPNLNAEISFLQEFAHDDQLLRGKEGYALVTLQASLHFMNICPNFDTLFDG